MFCLEEVFLVLLYFENPCLDVLHITLVSLNKTVYSNFTYSTLENYTEVILRDFFFSGFHTIHKEQFSARSNCCVWLLIPDS